MSAARLAARSTRWWMPGPVGVGAILLTVALMLSSAYYRGYFLAFNLNLQQVGLDRTEILFRLLPYGVALGGLAAALVFLVLVSHYYFEDTVSKQAIAGARQRPGRAARTRSRMARWIDVTGASLLLSLVAGGALLGLVAVLYLHDHMFRVGQQEARRFIESPYNMIYESYAQATFGTPSSVSVISWADDSEGNVLNVERQEDARLVLARIIAQSGSTTAYLDLSECVVRVVPTERIVITHGLTTYSEEEPLEIIKPCQPTEVKGG